MITFVHRDDGRIEVWDAPGLVTNRDRVLYTLLEKTGARIALINPEGPACSITVLGDAVVFSLEVNRDGEAVLIREP